MLTRIRRDPALVAGLVQAVLAALVAFGVDLTPDQTAAILGVAAALLALVVRRKVTPVGDPRLPKGAKAARYEP